MGDADGAEFSLYNDAGTQKVRIAGSTVDTFFNGGGNVGIGTTNPGRLLNLYHATAPFLRIDGGNVDGGIELYRGGAKKWAIYNEYSTGSSDSLRFNNAGGDWVTIKSDGNVGIGTTAPGALFNVEGSVSTVGTNGLGYFYNTYNNYDTNPTIAYPVLRIVRGGKSGYSFSSTMDIGISRWQNPDPGTDTRAYTQADFLLSHDNVGSPDVTVMSLRSNGNVGIGTTAPNFIFDAAGKINST